MKKIILFFLILAESSFSQLLETSERTSSSASNASFYMVENEVLKKTGKKLFEILADIKNNPKQNFPSTLQGDEFLASQSAVFDYMKLNSSTRNLNLNSLQFFHVKDSVLYLRIAKKNNLGNAVKGGSAEYLIDMTNKNIITVWGNDLTSLGLRFYAA